MTNRTSQPLSAWFLASDVGLTAAGWLAAYLVRFRAGLIPIYRDVPEFSAYVGNLPLVVILALVTFRTAGMYEVHRMRRFRAVLAARRAGWAVLRHLRSRGINQSHALIVGTGRLARRTARTLRAASWTGI